MTIKKLTTIGICSLSLTLGVALSASANTLVKTVENGRDIIYVKNLSPDAEVTLTTTGGSRAVAVLANSCGIVRVRGNQVTPGQVNINGTNRSIATPVSVTETPTCNGSNAPWTGGLTSEPRKDAQNNYYFSGYTANTAATVLVINTGSRTARANDCGFARFAEPAEGNPWGTSFAFSIGTSNYTLGDLTAQNYPPLCRNVNGTAIRYEPAI